MNNIKEIELFENLSDREILKFWAIKCQYGYVPKFSKAWFYEIDRNKWILNYTIYSDLESSMLFSKREVETFLLRFDHDCDRNPSSRFAINRKIVDEQPRFEILEFYLVDKKLL